MKNIYVRFLLGLALVFGGGSVMAQVTLGTSPYSQNFDGIAAGLPTGWQVYTGATTTSLGSPSTFGTAPQGWSAGIAGFVNFASTTSTVGNGGILLTGSSSTANQASSTNRALGMQQTAAFGDPGISTDLRITNTTGLTNFSLSFALQQGSTTAGRVTTFRVDYGVGTAPTTFTTATTSPTTLTVTSGTFGSTNVTVNFGNALDNISQNVWIRIWAPSAATGSGTRAASGIDDVNLSWISGPTITPSPTTLTGLSYQSGFGPSAAQTFTLAASNLTAGGGNITITPPASGNYEISVTSPGTAGYSTSALTLPYTGTGALANNTIWVRLKAGLAINTYNGQSVAIAGGSATSSVTVSGSVTRAVFTSVADGDWNTGSTWDKNPATPGPDDDVIINHAVTFNAAITRNNGTTTTVSANKSLAARATYTNNGITNINGTFQLDGGGFANGANNFVYAATASYLVFNNGGTYGVGAAQSFWPAANGPYNVTVNPSSNVDLNGGVPRTVGEFFYFLVVFITMGE